MASPACTVKDGAGSPQTTPPYATVTAANTVTIALASTTGVNTWAITCTAADESTDPSSITLTVDSATKTATFTAPAAGKSLIFTSTINGATDINGTNRTDWTTTFKVAVPTATGYIVCAVGEKLEHSATYGWVSPVNAAIRAAGGGGPPTGAAGGDLAGTYPNPTVSDLTIASEARGDLLMRGAAAWGRHAPGSSGTYLKSAGAGADLVWDTPGAAGSASGDLSGTYPSPTVAKIQTRTVASTAPLNGQVYVYNSGASEWQPGSGLYVARDVTCTGVLTAGAQTNTTVYTVPASPSGNGRFVCTAVILRLNTALVGAGSNALTVGTTNGGTHFLTTKTIDSGTTVGTIYGLTLADLGASMVATDGYNATLAASTNIIVSLAVTGTVTTEPVLTATVLGFYV